MGLKLFRVDISGVLGASMDASIVPPPPVTIQGAAALQSTFNLTINRTSLVNINFSEIPVQPNTSYSFVIPAGFWVDQFGEPSLEQTISFTTPNPSSVSSFIPTGSIKNTYGEEYVYLTYDKNVTLQNKNYYLYSDYGNPSGTLVATYNAISSGKVSIINGNTVRISVKNDTVPLRHYWIRAEQGVVKDDWGLQSAAITGTSYDFKAFINSQSALSSSYSMISKAIKSPTLTLANSGAVLENYINGSAFYKNMFATLTSSTSDQVSYSLRVKVYNADTGQLIRDKSFNWTRPSQSNFYISLKINSTHFAVAFSVIPSSTLDSGWTDSSEVRIYSIGTGNLTQTITANESAGVGHSMAFNDTKLLISCPFESTGYTAGVRVYNFNPSTGTASYSSKITRPVAPWYQFTNTRKSSFFAINDSDIVLNDTYFAIRSDGDSSTDANDNIRIYTLSGTYQRKITFSGSKYFLPVGTSINNNNLILVSDGTTSLIYDAANGNLLNTFSYIVQGISDEFAIINNKLYELGTGLFFTNNVYSVSSTTHLFQSSNTSFYRYE